MNKALDNNIFIAAFVRLDKEKSVIRVLDQASLTLVCAGYRFVFWIMYIFAIQIYVVSQTCTNRLCIHVYAN